MFGKLYSLISICIVAWCAHSSFRPNKESQDRNGNIEDRNASQKQTNHKSSERDKYCIRKTRLVMYMSWQGAQLEITQIRSADFSKIRILLNVS